MKLPQTMKLSSPQALAEFYRMVRDEIRQLENPTVHRLGDNTIRYGAAAPTSGTFVRGDIVFSTVPAASGKVGWTCVTAGSPGTWKAFGAIDA